MSRKTSVGRERQEEKENKSKRQLGLGKIWEIEGKEKLGLEGFEREGESDPELVFEKV